MKKFYETPAVEFTGFDVEDIITTSGGGAEVPDTPVVPENINSADPANAVKVANAVATLDAGATVGAAVYSSSYNW